MYTSKHTSLSPNQFMRPQRDHSPSHKHQSKPHKYYSAQQVSRILKSYVQPKINYLKNQLQQKQKIIQTLNQKLDNNDRKINQMQNYIQKMINYIKQQQKPTQVTSVINQILNDKLKQCWQTVNNQIYQLKQTFAQNCNIDTKKIQAKIEYELENMKKQSAQFIEGARVRNNNYWLKIKQALNRINSKLNKVDQSLIKTNQNAQNYKRFNSQQRQYINQLQKSKTVIKKLIQLKKSVQNIYQNYQTVLALQNQFKNNLTYKQNHNSIKQLQKDLIDLNDSNSNQIHQGGNTFPLFRKKNLNNQQIYQQKLQNATSQFYQPSYNNQDINKQDPFSQQNFLLQYSKQQNPNQVYRASLPSKFIDNDKNAFPNKYYVPNISNKKTVSNSNSNFIFRMQSPTKNTPQSVKWQTGINSPNQLSCLNSSSNVLRNAASRSTSFVNLSLQNRNQMSQSVKQRLQQMIELKNISKPISVYLDEINYLKNSQGNYLFDTRGNMFKINVQDGRQLERLGIIKFIDKGNPRQSIASKKNRIMFGNTNSSQNENIKSKSVGISNSKIKSISIKQTVI